MESLHRLRRQPEVLQPEVALLSLEERLASLLLGFPVTAVASLLPGSGWLVVFAVTPPGPLLEQRGAEVVAFAGSVRRFPAQPGGVAPALWRPLARAEAGGFAPCRPN